MKTPDEIKNGLKCCSDMVYMSDCAECAYCAQCADEYDKKNITPGAAVMRDALAYIQQLEAAHRTEYCEESDYDCKALGEARKRIAEFEAQIPKWISVAERLPDNPGEVLMVLHGRVCNAWYHCDGRFESGSGFVWRAGSGSVTHWMPPPEPPKEDANA